MEHGRLAGAVGADEADDLAGLDAEAEAIHRGEAAEALGDGVDLEDHRRFRAHPMIPCGRNEMTRISTRPYSITSTPARPRMAARESSETGVSTKAPITGPTTVPAPPTMACSRPWIDTDGPNVMVGSM